MPRRSGVWRRAKKDWFTTLGGKQVWVGPQEYTKKQALAVLTQIEATEAKGERRPAGRLFNDVVTPFLADAERRVERDELSPLTLEGYRRFILPAGDALGRYPVASMQAQHVDAWLRTHGKGWNATTRNNALTALKACLNWAVRTRLIEANPIKDMRKPSARTAETDLPPEKARAVLAGIEGREFLDLITVLFGTGARPSEAYALEARHLDLEGGYAVMDSKTTRRTNTKRTIYLSPPAAAVLSRLAGSHPDGPLLRNRLGKPWTRHAVAHRFARLRKQLGLGHEATAKAFRSAFVTDGLENGVPIATVAELVGHRGTKMVEKHYSRLSERRDHLRSAARKIRPDESS